MFGQNILNYWEDIYRDFGELISFPSVQSDPLPGMPFGKGSYDALQWFIHRAEEMGLSVYNAENKAGHAEYGEGEEHDAVLVHLDVVPAGEGWATDPFTLTEKDGVLYGRGIADDKGFAVVALYCLKALKDYEIKGKRKMRVIFGANEEGGMEDMKAYYGGTNPQPLPHTAFTPDVEYTVCNREKGILQFQLTAPSEKNGFWMSGGGVINAVAGTAEAEVSCTQEEFGRLEKLSKECPCAVDIQPLTGGVRLTIRGVASHAMEPQKGLNAVEWLLWLITQAKGKTGNPVCDFVHRFIGLEYDGRSIGVQVSDEPSGPLTLNLGYLHMEGNITTVGVDIRYPVTADGKALIAIIQEKAETEGIAMEIIAHKEPLYLPEDAPFIQLLVSAYEDITGKKAVVYSTGGGTYARSLQGRGVGFGGAFLDSDDTCIHTNKEHISVADMKLHAQICLEAMYRMMTAED